MTDPDFELYLHQEADTLRRNGWTVTAPKIGPTPPSRCIGVAYEGCPVRTPRLRCRWCNKTRRLREKALRRAKLREVA